MLPFPNSIPDRFHPSLGIPLIITEATLKLVAEFKNGFPSLFRDSSDHHAWQSDFPDDCRVSFHPSLGIPLIITKGGAAAGVQGRRVSIPL